jgi:hypothetical protein
MSKKVSAILRSTLAIALTCLLTACSEAPTEFASHITKEQLIVEKQHNDLMNKQNLAAARQLLDEELKKHPKNSTFTRGGLMQRQRLLRRSLEDCNRALELNKRNAFALKT